MPRAPGSPVRAQTVMTPARSPEVIHCLLPLITHESPSRRALVRRAAASDPECGSDSPNDAASNRPEVISGTYRLICAGVPNLQIVSATMLLTPMVTAVEAQPCAISIIASA